LTPAGTPGRSRPAGEGAHEQDGKQGQEEGVMERMLLTVGEVAEVLGVGRNKVYELMYRGELHSVKLGGLRRVTRPALDDFLRRLSGDAA
jgi:excisionase family DNA binding protein